MQITRDKHSCFQEVMIDKKPFTMPFTRCVGTTKVLDFQERAGRRRLSKVR
jgi:hypothetical protein